MNSVYGGLARCEVTSTGIQTTPGQPGPSTSGYQGRSAPGSSAVTSAVVLVQGSVATSPSSTSSSSSAESSGPSSGSLAATPAASSAGSLRVKSEEVLLEDFTQEPGQSALESREPETASPVNQSPRYMMNWYEAEMVVAGSAPVDLSRYLSDPPVSSPEIPAPRKRKSRFPTPEELQLMIQKLQSLLHLNVISYRPSSFIQGTTRITPGFWDPLIAIIPESRGCVKRFFLQFPLELVEQLDPSRDSLLKTVLHMSSQELRHWFRYTKAPRYVQQWLRKLYRVYRGNYNVTTVI
ncbi:GSCOCG00010924001-RA-CDS [Cotesia congregata]|nr:GSCOCG00010924001-RA-CDS [Cotesia congregata]